MFKIENGRLSFYQWDINQRLIVEDSTITEVHFCNKTSDCALVCGVYEEDNKRLVNVPNILLQEDWVIYVFAYSGNHTRHEESFIVYSRTKPDSYIYNETEVKSFELLEKRIEALEKNGGGSGSGGEVDLTGYATEEYVDNAIANIDIPEVEGVVKYEAQNLTDEQKTQARDNIGADGYSWHEINVFDDYKIVIANVPGKESITDWEAAASVVYSYDSSSFVLGYMVEDVCSIFKNYSPSSEKNALEFLQYLADDYNLLKEANIFNDNTTIYFAVKGTLSNSVYSILSYGNGYYKVCEYLPNGSANTIEYNFNANKITSKTIDYHSKHSVLAYQGKENAGKVLSIGSNGMVVPSAEELATKEYVNDAIGEATKEKEFELIERVDTTEEITSFTRDKEPDGTPYDFKRLYLIVKNAAYEKTLGGSIYINGKFAVTSPHIVHTKPVLTQVVAEVANGALRANGRSISAESSSVYGYINMTADGFMCLGETAINKVSAYMGSNVFPIGTVFEIWGVRS